MLLEYVLKEFLFDCKMRKLSERTLKSYRNNNMALIRYLKNEFKITELTEVHYKAIQAYIKFLMDKELKETYINGLIKCFRAFFKYCYDEEYIKVNPMDKIKFQKTTITCLWEYLSITIS